MHLSQCESAISRVVDSMHVLTRQSVMPTREDSKTWRYTS